MEGIQVTTGGRKLLFATTGEVADTSGAAPLVKGMWHADSDAKDNTVGYTFEGFPQTSLAAIYTFTAANQLSVALKGDTTSAAFVFPGFIEVDSDHDFLYHLVDATGADTGVEFVLYGKYEFEKTSNDLVLHLTGGGDAHVVGDSGAQSLDLALNTFADFKGNDLLEYHASTVNQFPGPQDPVVIPATLAFVGSWDIQNGDIVFLSEIKGTEGKEAVTLGFAGKFKGVTTGFVYHTDGDTTEVALSISGQHVFNSDRSTTTLAWDTSIGFTGKTFQAHVGVTLAKNTDNHSVVVTGSLDIAKDQDKGVSLDLTLEATYTLKKGELVFQAKVDDDGGQLSYDLMLQGNFVYRNLSITFTADFGSAAGANTVAVAVGITGDKQSMIQNLQLMLNISGTQAAVQVNLSFEARLHFVDGKRVIEKTAAQ